MTFNMDHLVGSARESNIKRFYDDGDIPDGKQDMDIYVNDIWKGSYVLQFHSNQKDIYITADKASSLGVNLSTLVPEEQPKGTYTLNKIVQGGNVQVDVSTLSVKLTIPQRFVHRIETNYVAPEFWSEGISALMLSYNATWYQTNQKSITHATRSDLYVGTESGMNIWGWQLRDNSVFSKNSGTSDKWQNNTRYIRKPLVSITSNVTAGDIYSPGSLFDSLRMRGISLVSDENMRPNSQKGFAPIIRGTAQSNALVKVIQNGHVIYQENIPPGPFAIHDIQPTGSAGDLLVSINESDGTVKSFNVPFSSVPNMLKEGVWKYELSAGTARPSGVSYQPNFIQGSFSYGLNNLVTGYTGFIGSNHYMSYLLGSAWNLPIGAFSLDVLHADTTLPGHKMRGQNMRMSFSKFMDMTATNFTLASYYYSTQGYYSFNEAIYSYDNYHHYKDYYDLANKGTGRDSQGFDHSTWDVLRGARPKNTLTLNVTQSLGQGNGAFFISGSRREYWTENKKNQEYQLGYSNMWKDISYSLSASRTHNTRSREEETNFYLSTSIPFSIFGKNTWMSMGISAKESHYQYSNISLNGTLLESNKLSYSLSGANQQGGQTQVSANTVYRTPFSTLGASLSESHDYRQSGLSARGTGVVIPWHLLTANEVGKTMTIINAPQAHGLKVNGDESILTNKSGLALVPYSTPYRRNTFTLSSSDESSGAEVIGNIASSIPYEGAVELVTFETDLRKTLIMHAIQKNGHPLPFGAELFDIHKSSIGYVGQSSMLYIKADKKPDRVLVQLKNGICSVDIPVFPTNRRISTCY